MNVVDADQRVPLVLRRRLGVLRFALGILQHKRIVVDAEETAGQARQAEKKAVQADADRVATIAAFARDFKPEWQPPREAYSEWHYMVLGPGKEGAAHFDAPIVEVRLSASNPSPAG